MRLFCSTAKPNSHCIWPKAAMLHHRGNRTGGAQLISQKCQKYFWKGNGTAVGVWGLCRQWGPGAKPWSAGQEDKVPLKLMTIY